VPAVATLAIAPTTLSNLARQRIFLYLGVLIFLLAFAAPSGGLIDIPISLFLKNKLHLKAHELADFRLVSAIPLYLSCVFGFMRDIWNPFGMRDRGFMLLFGTITAGLYVSFSFIPITYFTLLLGVMLLTTSFLFVLSAQNGMTSMVGQQHAMSGQISTVWSIFASVPTMGALLMGGTLSELLEDMNADQAAHNPIFRRCRDHGLRRLLRCVERRSIAQIAAIRAKKCPGVRLNLIGGVACGPRTT